MASIDIQRPPAYPTFNFDPSVAPPTSKWVPPRWMVEHDSAPQTPKYANVNGLGEPWDPRRPVFKGVDLTKPDPRIRVPSVEMKAANGSDDSVVAFVDVNIIDSTGKEPYHGDVLVKGKRIISVGDKLSPETLKGARVFQGKGRTLMSGLCDAHSHMSFNNSETMDGLTNLDIEEHTLFTARSAHIFLDCGYTMCLGAASVKQRLDMVVRDAINQGQIPGPRYLANGQEMAPPDGALIPGITKFVNDADDIVKAVKVMAGEGVDAVKFSMSGDEILDDLRAEDTTFPDDMVAAGSEAAHACGIRVCSHARSDESVVQCLQYGVDIIYHASFVSDSTMLALEAQKDRVYVAPTLNFPYATVHEAQAKGFPVTNSQQTAYTRELDIAIATMREMKKRGIKIMPGGDYGFAWTPHGTYRDLEHFVKLLGYTPMEAILSATALGGEIMLHPNELGKVQPGYYADLLLVNGNPLEDISLLSKRENLDVIMINGKVHKETIGDHPLQYELEKSLAK